MRRTAVVSLFATLLAVSAAQARADASPATAAVDPHAITAACGGDFSEAQAATMPAAEMKTKLTCFTREGARAFNAKLPMQVDKTTVLQRVSAEGTTLTYYYKVDLLRSELRPGAVDALTPQVRKGVCENKDMATVVKIGGAYRYLWYDRNDELIGELLVASC